MKENDRNKTALALHYNGVNAPIVVAKGSGELAKKIIDVANTYNIPIHEDPDLITLLAQLDIGNEIPESLYIVIAEVIAYAYILTGKIPDNFDSSTLT